MKAGYHNIWRTHLVLSTHYSKWTTNRALVNQPLTSEQRLATTSGHQWTTQRLKVSAVQAAGKRAAGSRRGTNKQQATARDQQTSSRWTTCERVADSRRTVSERPVDGGLAAEDQHPENGQQGAGEYYNKLCWSWNDSSGSLNTEDANSGSYKIMH